MKSNKPVRCIIDSSVRYMSVSQVLEYTRKNRCYSVEHRDSTGPYLEFKPKVNPHLKLVVNNDST